MMWFFCTITVLQRVLMFVISSLVMLEFNIPNILLHSQAGNVKNQHPNLIPFLENINFAENISIRKVQSKVFWKFFLSLLINERPLMNFAGKIPEALNVAQATTIYDVRIDFLFVKCAWPDCFFPSRLRCLI